jgi:phospholipase C
VTNSGFVTGPFSGKWFDYVVVIMMENHGINNTYGISIAPNNPSIWNRTNCTGNCTYFDSFANSNGLAEEFTIDGIQSPSLGSYIAITSGFGNTPGNCNNVSPGGSSCPLLQNLTIVDRLEKAGLSWKAYMEGNPLLSGCANNDAGAPLYYHVNHNPFIYYANIQNSTARCSHIVRANSNPASQNGCWPSTVQNDTVLINDLNHPLTMANYSFLTPNTVDDAHDCNDISVANAWANLNIPQILNSAVFKTKRAALFIAFDEDGCTFSIPACPASPNGEFYAVWASNPANPTTKSGLKSNNPHTFYDPLRTIEDNWRLQPLIPSTDGSSSGMREFLLP